jgi:two-component system, OmpR family, sensor histidine kinase SenX3
MGRGFRLPMFVVAAAMFGLIAVLATLQYHWLGRISEAERERMTATLNTRATGFAQDFDRELTRAYLLFQIEPLADGDGTAGRIAARYDRWQATARFPRMVKAIYVVSSAQPDGQSSIKRFNPSTRFVEPAEWPENLAVVREQLLRQHQTAQPMDGVTLRGLPSMVVDDVPALVVPTPLILFNHQRAGGIDVESFLSCAILVLDREYLVNELLPSLAEHHFRGAGEGFDYRLAVIRPGAKEIVYHSSSDYSPAPDARADAAVDLFQVRVQEFSALAAEVRRFSTFVAAAPRPSGGGGGGRHTTIVRETTALPPGLPRDRLTVRETSPRVSILVQDSLSPTQKTAVSAGVSAATRATAAPKWKLMVKHPAGSLETAVQTVRRRNVLVSSGVLALLGASMGLLVLSTRRAQRLAAQQLEFVAAVSHELRTPLAVIRSAGENLADGVVRSDDQVKKYGDLVRNEGRRLTEMVEQILEFAGIQSGQRGFALRPVTVRPLLEGIVDSSRTLIEDAGLEVDIDVPVAIPAVLGDETALRRVFQNLVGNAIKYGASGGWIGLKALSNGRDVFVTVSDRGIGIAASEHARIFEPFYRTHDVIAAQIQGAGLGLSLVKRIIEAHSGRITVRSVPGQGSEFTVQLPSAGHEPIGATDAGESPQAAAHAAGFQS